MDVCIHTCLIDPNNPEMIFCRIEIVVKLIRTAAIRRGLPYVLLRVYSIPFSTLCSGFFDTLKVRPADVLSPEVSCTHLCNYNLVGCDVADVCR